MSPRTLRRALAPIALLALAQAASRLAPAAPAQPRDLVLVVIDTLRADHVGLYGYERRATTPRIDAFARRGAWVANAWANAPWTPPSVMSILTSLEPAVHGLDWDGFRYVERVPALPLATRTLAEVLRAQGYVTLAVTAGGGVGRHYGFERGFERFYQPEPPTPPEDVATGVERALLWLAEAPRDRPVFLFFHTYEVHGPNTHGSPVAGDDPATAARRAYDADLAFADGEIGRLLDGLRPRLDRALVVITADHGENLHDRSLNAPPVTHGHHLYQELLRVPLIVVAPGLVPEGRRVAGDAQLVDVMPTALSLLGASSAGLVMQGRDLRGALLGQATLDRARPLFASAPLQGPTWSAVRTRASTAILMPQVTGTQWWHRLELPAESLFDRGLDSGETTNLAAAQRERLRALARLLLARQTQNAALRRRLGAPPASDAAREAGEALRALGYVDP